ncbi:MAG TPA: GAF domain-containing protein [Candidatus Binatia bacterium]
MIAEVGTRDVRSFGEGARTGGFVGALRESASFLSTRLLRELLAADARSEASSDDVAVRASALLDVALAGFEVATGAFVLLDPARHPQCVAARGLPDHARELLETTPAELATIGGSLVQRALTERRVLLLDRSTREPLMPALREGSPEIECAAIVPLFDLAQPVGVLVLASRAGRLNATLLRSHAVTFRLLGLLLSPGRGRSGPAQRDDAAAAPADVERYLFEIEELTARLAEAREAERVWQERASSAETALRAETESARARIAELEAQLAGASPQDGRLRELEELCALQARTIDEREQRIRELEDEIALVRSRVEESRAATTSALHGNGSTSWNGAAAEEDDDLETLELPENGDEQLGDIAAAAVAALEEQDGEDQGAEVEAAPEPEEVDLGEVEEASSLDAVVDDVRLEHAVLHVDSNANARELVRDTAEASGAAYWSGEGDVPSATTSIAAVNLLDASLGVALQNDSELWSAHRWIVYGTTDAGTGFELGWCSLLRRPIDPKRCVEQMQRAVGRKLGGIVFVSAQLRELAPLRQAVQEIDAAGSVACDTRQALDLLEIVRRPDAIVIDLALPHGQGLGLAAQLRREPETSNLPLLLLLPAQLDHERLREDAERAQLLGPFTDEDVRRIVRAVLAGRH